MNNQQYKELLKRSNLFNKQTNEIRINAGCGPNVFPQGWINYDREDLSAYITYLKIVITLDGMPEDQKKLAIYLRNGGNLDFRVHDFLKGFPQHVDNSIDGIYLGQVIEHINRRYEIPYILKECHRILKPGKVLRITTPDLDLLIQAYLNNQMNKFENEQPDFYKKADPSSQLAYIMYGASGESCKQTAYDGHFFLYTQKSMIEALSEVGFKNPVFYYESGKSIDPVMKKEVVDYGMSHSFICEVIK